MITENTNRHVAPVQPVATNQPIVDKNKPVAAKPLTKEQRKARVEAYLKLVQLGAAPAITFDAEHDALYQEVYAQAVKDVEKERYDEIIKNRKILDLGTGHDQMNVPEPADHKAKRIGKDKDIDEGALVIGGDNRVRTPAHDAETSPSGYAGTKSVNESEPTEGKKGGVQTTKIFGG